MLRRVVLEGSSVLRTKCPAYPLEKIHEIMAASTNGDLNALLLDMHQTMVAENGMGLAANQVGWLLRIFILKDNSLNGHCEYINPEVMSQEELVDFEGEGCLSIPGVTANTKRFNKLKLVWQDRLGTTHTGDFEGMKAFAVQHEMDHLNGKLYVDQFGPIKKSLVLGKHKKYLRELGRS